MEWFCRATRQRYLPTGLALTCCQPRSRLSLGGSPLPEWNLQRFTADPPLRKTGNGWRCALVRARSTTCWGSTAITANSSGVKSAEIRYYPWGTERYTSGGTPTSFQFTGRREESGLGLYFNNSRFYDPSLARFIQADSIIPQQQGVQLGHDLRKEGSDVAYKTGLHVSRS
jgi:RHS repeat-associated protein